MVSTSAISSALSGLKVSQASINVLTDNIANANADGYSRREVTQAVQVVGGVPRGVEIESVQRRVDDFLESSIRTQTSRAERYKSLASYMDRVSVLFGQPEAGNSLASVTDNFLNSLNDLANNPDQGFYKSLTVERAKELVSRISTMASDLENIRFAADQEIEKQVTILNEKIDALRVVNLSINEANARAQDKTALLDQRDKLIRDITEIVDVGVVYKASEEVVLFTNSAELVSPGTRYQLSYTRQPSASAFINDAEFNAITVTPVDADGVVLGSGIDMVTSGSSDEVTTAFDYGILKGLLDVRDTEIPNILAQLDEFASTFAEEFNAIHNNGSGFPPRNSINGTTLIADTESRVMSGQVRIALVGTDGQPINAPWSNEDKWRPLTLDLDTLNSGAGDGIPTMQTIVDEINEYYGPPQDRVSLGPLADIKLVAVSDDAGPPFEFDFELDNSGSYDAVFTVTSVTVADGGVSVSAIPTALSTTGITMEPGERARTGNTNTVDIDFSGGTTGPTYTVQVGVQVVSNGVTYTETIDYVVDATATSVRNDRYIVDGISGSGDGQVVSPTGVNPYVVARIVDSNGNPASSGEEGYLQLYGYNSSYRIVIDELDSEDEGTQASPSTTATGRGFSHYFGLNNFFVESSTVNNSAYNMAIRSDIVATPAKITTGNITRSVQPSDGTALHTYELGSGSNSTVLALSALRETAVSFDSAGGIVDISTTLTDYTIQMTSYSALQLKTANNSQSREESLLDLYNTRRDEVSGVNLDEELANTILYQTSYAASARVLNTLSELFDLLLDSVR
ncbi:MAG: flagellar hook-associated protein FlgK [Hyphomicrobiales bacterium]|nr:flagellar hook-associated protein FlgK [Rickettsiales bacterium]MCP5361298.1 flagellar hook-associated protein FlgK [Hyphomicrobiales bacterium]